MNEQMSLRVARVNVRAGPFEPWEADHTGLVHVLWACDIYDGADEIAGLIMQSRWFQAVKHVAAGGVS